MIRLILENVERLVDSEAKAARLEGQGFVRLKGKEETAVGKEPAADNNNSDNDQMELSDLSAAELRKMAKDKGIKGVGSLTKAELIEALEESLED